MCRPPRIPLNADERTARRSVPATFVGCAQKGVAAVFALTDKTKNGGILVLYYLSHLTHFNRIDNVRGISSLLKGVWDLSHLRCDAY